MSATDLATRPNAGPWIELDKLVVHRGGREVLRGLTAQLSGRACGLVGENGAGKSTLIAALLGVLRPTSGRASVLRHPLPSHAMSVRARAGVMAEQAGVFPGGSAVDAVAFAGALTGLGWSEALRRAHRSLDALDVGEERYRAAEELSTGMRQRVKLAMALVHDPEVLILDEPTNGLDPPARADLLRLIADLREQGRRILLSTHLIDEAEQLCDEVLLLKAGEVHFCGPVQALVGTVARTLRAEGPNLGPLLATRLPLVGVPVHASGSDWLELGAPDDATLARFWAEVASNGAAVKRLHAKGRRLEDAVLDAMTHSGGAHG